MDELLMLYMTKVIFYHGKVFYNLLWLVISELALLIVSSASLSIRFTSSSHVGISV